MVEENIIYPDEYYTVVKENCPNSLQIEDGVYYVKKKYTQEQSKKIYEQAMEYLVVVEEKYDHDDMGSYSSQDKFSPLASSIVVCDGNFYGCLMRGFCYSFGQPYTYEDYKNGDVILKPDIYKVLIYSSDCSRSSDDQHAYLIKK